MHVSFGTEPVRPARTDWAGQDNARSRCKCPGAAGTGRTGSGRVGPGSPARSRAATTRRAVPRRPWPGPAPPAPLRATCRRRLLLLRAARRLPPARPMSGGASLRGGAARYYSGGSRTGPRRSEPPLSALPLSLLLLLLPAGHRPASCTWQLLRLSRDRTQGGEPGGGRSLRSGRPAVGAPQPADVLGRGPDLKFGA